MFPKQFGFSDLLSDSYDINTKIVGLEGHVVVYYKSSTLEMFIAPSLGISFETDYYNTDSQLSSIQKITFPDLGKCFNQEENTLPDEYGDKGYRPIFFVFEKLINLLKYLLPLTILFYLNTSYFKKLFRK